MSEIRADTKLTAPKINNLVEALIFRITNCKYQ